MELDTEQLEKMPTPIKLNVEEHDCLNMQSHTNSMQMDVDTMVGIVDCVANYYRLVRREI